MSRSRPWNATEAGPPASATTLSPPAIERVVRGALSRASSIVRILARVFKGEEERRARGRADVLRPERRSSLMSGAFGELPFNTASVEDPGTGPLISHRPARGKSRESRLYLAQSSDRGRAGDERPAGRSSAILRPDRRPAHILVSRVNLPFLAAIISGRSRIRGLRDICGYGDETAARGAVLRGRPPRIPSRTRLSGCPDRAGHDRGRASACSARRASAAGARPLRACVASAPPERRRRAGLTDPADLREPGSGALGGCAARLGSAASPYSAPSLPGFGGRASFPCLPAWFPKRVRRRDRKWGHDQRHHGCG